MVTTNPPRMIASTIDSIEDNDLTPLRTVVNAGLSLIIKAERYLPVSKLDGVSLLWMQLSSDRGWNCRLTAG